MSHSIILRPFSLTFSFSILKNTLILIIRELFEIHLFPDRRLNTKILGFSSVARWSRCTDMTPRLWGSLWGHPCGYKLAWLGSLKCSEPSDQCALWILEIGATYNASLCFKAFGMSIYFCASCTASLLFICYLATRRSAYVGHDLE